MLTFQRYTTLITRLCNCSYILFTKLPRPWDSKVTFRSSSQAATCPPVYHTRWRLHAVPLIAERQASKVWIPIFKVFGLTRPGNEPKSTVSAANALSTRPLIGVQLYCFFCFFEREFSSSRSFGRSAPPRMLKAGSNLTSYSVRLWTGSCRKQWKRSFTSRSVNSL